MTSSPILSEILAFLLAAECSGCDAPGTLLCTACRRALRAEPLTVHTPGGLRVHAALRFDAVPARCIRRLKEDGQTLLARPLGRALSEALAEALSEVWGREPSATPGGA
ncbi:MAG: ComF family protein, partial [Microbacterium sp.]